MGEDEEDGEGKCHCVELQAGDLHLSTRFRDLSSQLLLIGDKCSETRKGLEFTQRRVLARVYEGKLGFVS